MDESRFLARIKELYGQHKKIPMNTQDIESAVGILDIEDMKLRFFIGDLVVYQEEKSIPFLLDGIGDDKPEIRRSAIFLLGRILKKDKSCLSEEILYSLEKSLQDEDPKVRKNSGVVLGSLARENSSGKLIQALEKETVEWVRPSLILALGAIGGQQVKEYLSAYREKDPKEAEALHKALEHLQGKKADAIFVSSMADPLTVQLWTFEGITDILLQEIAEKMGIRGERISTGIVKIQTRNLYDVFRLRTFTEVLIPVGDVPYGELDEVPSRVVKLLLGKEGFARIDSLHEKDEGLLRYRLEIRGKNVKHPVRKKMIKNITEQVGKASLPFINSPSSYDIEIRVMIRKKAVSIAWKPFTIPDQRFAYRHEDVPASIHPVAAAGIIRLVKPELYGDLRVLDPFCGSGTLLIEQEIHHSCRELVGIDISSRAMHAARENVHAAGLNNISLMQMDARDISPQERFSGVISNMPFGIRVGDHKENEKLYADFFRMLPGIIEKNGFILLYTQEIELTSRLFEKTAGLKLLDTRRIAAGGLKPAVFIGKRV